MRPEDEVKKRVRLIFDMRNISEMSRRTGYPKETLRGWKNDPLRMKAVDLIRLEQKTGIAMKGERK
mgnify:CR=1 FL=1|jgi:hypothetical protein